ncbi:MULTISPECIES: hypothetical protein [Caproicibacterium]|uniref:Uncharacterized protein n=1 Tax=Caproicibacterium lactatifermentans TaxID=2666138 RepID=A0ABX6PWF8_9FIRM|nr:hypothetical protein [Caproicibacterium lactatifermentans]QKO30648.1 hypothetical protein GKP14_06330 [Caproicibacterium lactatifermentans]
MDHIKQRNLFSTFGVKISYDANGIGCVASWRFLLSGFVFSKQPTFLGGLFLRLRRQMLAGTAANKPAGRKIPLVGTVL